MVKTSFISCCIKFCLIFGLLPFCLHAGQPETKKSASSPPHDFPFISVANINIPPFLDGIAVDKCWQQAQAYQLLITNPHKNDEIKLQACTDGKKIFFLIRYLTESENRQHQIWHWDPVLQAYIPGKEKEETFTIVLAEKSENNKYADIWVWRAARTDPVNKADDLFYFESDQVNHPKKSIIMDAGQHCWFSKYFGDYAGGQLPRFYNRTPKGSVADINAKGNWDKKQLNIEFSRLLDTGHKDDIQLKKGKYYIQVHRGIPTIKTINRNKFIPLVIK